jgi:anti-sigma-K factor RskA
MTKHLHLNDELQEKASLFAAGALPEDERKEYVRHLEEDGCEVCRAEAFELQSVVHALAMGLPSNSPSPDVKKRLMAQAELAASTPAIPQSRKRSLDWFGWWAAAAVSVAMGVVLVFNVDLRRQIHSLTTRVAELESRMVQQRTLLAKFTAPRVRVLTLAGQGATPQAGARIFWDEEARTWSFFANELPRVSEDRAYQLWFVPKTGNPISAGVFNTGPDGSVNIEIPISGKVEDLKVAAVTTEPAGGLPQPTGAFVLLGTFQ